MFSQTHTLRLDENISCDFLKNKRVQECIKEDSSIFALVLLYNVNIDSMVNETNDTDIQNEIDAISGATITGDGVSDMIIERVENYLPYFNSLNNE